MCCHDYYYCHHHHHDCCHDISRPTIPTMKIVRVFLVPLSLVSQRVPLHRVVPCTVPVVVAAMIYYRYIPHRDFVPPISHMSIVVFVVYLVVVVRYTMIVSYERHDDVSGVIHRPVKSDSW